ncbi:ACT domain-containing protein [Enterococcus columbae]|uniref:UPF0237 protein I568_00535 n=1 Tax=Enterococcus columbae DSM 7374 = ATCC 51263 TaxID=1121865 RepID=S1P572_9ENTE|nr:ACT domain-containing protein [Enterococcus columbae]EOT44613.1 hypothetical protein OMW_00669 [Enterococcus columbae DSM 7374 = ATCC 51263]EOW87491.1 hypothetical protein I568_00535 [Enterococcus columbae DSM 7374 = ATCC 51263]OJG25147.1 hypothetical protein RR47_GL001935 [Enterococcus columbae DSM 7374 = ATCC 51263]
MRAILTVIGKDQVGIIAKVSQKLANLEINIIDVTQTILEEYFTMMMVLETKETIEFALIRNELDEVSQELGVDIRIQNAEIFDAMHKL